MRPLSRRLVSGILAPVLFLAVATFAILLFLFLEVTGKVREDYDRFALNAATSHIATVFGLAASELIAVHLVDTPVVVDAKKESVREAIRTFWSSSDLQGVLLDAGGAVLSSSLDPEATRAAVAGCGHDQTPLEIAGKAFHCRAYHFPLWDWTAVTVARRVPLHQLRPELVYFPLVLLLTALALTTVIVLVFRRTLSAPVARMVGDVAAGREVAATGLVEFDRIGEAVNSAVERLEQRTRQLAEELERRLQAEQALEESEEQLRQSQKMEAVGRLAGGIAHDFNNMLTAIVGFASVARDDAEAGSPQQDCADQVLAAAAKATELTRQILAFSRKQVMSPAPTDLNAIIRGMGKLLARVLGDDVQLVEDLAPGELVTMVDRAQIEQVLMNLGANARDAMPHGGRLTLTTRTVDFNADSAARLDLESTGRYALLTVADDGVGMDETTVRHVFEPFFTTKEMGKGTGLGLSIVYGIVRQHHGQIGVTSRPGRGATFRIHLKLTEAVASDAEVAPDAGVRGGSETVLVAEDNEVVSALVRKVLTGAGYRVLLARDGLEAERVHAEHAEEIALCLLDVVMPNRSGLEAAKTIRGQKPHARTLFMSGYAPELDGEEPGGVPLLAKPFTPRELLRRVREALDA